MRVPVLTAAPGAAWEADLVTEWGCADHGVTVVARCGDLADLLSTVATGIARAVLLSADLPWLGPGAVARLRAAVAVVGVVQPGDAQAEERLRRIGVGRVLPSDVGAADVARVVVDVAAERFAAGAAPWFAGPAGAPMLPPPQRPPAPPRGRGRVIAVWGPTGAPGRTAVAIGVADEAARLGVATLLVDADPYGGTVAQTLGVPGETAGLVLACRAATGGLLDTGRLAVESRRLRPSLRVLTGITRADQWPELPPAALRAVLEQARHLSALTIVDCGFCLERDNGLSYDTAASRRNGATLTALAVADTVLCVGAADPVGLQRLIRGLEELRNAVPAAVPLAVVNRVRATMVPSEPRREIEAALRRWAGIAPTAYLPAAPAVLDTAMRTRRTLAEAAPASPLRLAVVQLTRQLTGAPEPAPPPRRFRLRGRR